MATTASRRLSVIFRNLPHVTKAAHMRTLLWMQRVARQYGFLLAAIVLVASLAAKFFWPLLRFGVPMGYDAGIYRYLFVQHAEGFPPFDIATMQPWAYEHPLGLFFFSTILLKLGLPVDWLVGWIWNLVPVIVAIILARVIARREGSLTGVLVLLAALLSQAFFDGFAAMYWKTFVSLACFVLAIQALEKRSWWALLWGILTVVIHQQTGLLFGLSVALWGVVHIVMQGLQDKRLLVSREVLFTVGSGLIILVIGLLWYVPIWDIAVAPHLARLATSQAGSFPEPLYYLRTTGLLLACGFLGFVLSWRKERASLWQLSVLVTAVLIAGHFLFFRRFFLQFDFFLLPFAAMGMAFLWRRFSSPFVRATLIVLLVIQAVLSYRAAATRTPSIDRATFGNLQLAQEHVSAGATVIVLENITAPYVLGWLAQAEVGAPGLFSLPGWTYEQWAAFLMGTDAQRLELLAPLPRPLYLYASPQYFEYYEQQAARFLGQGCFSATVHPHLFHVTCPPPSPAQP